MSRRYLFTGEESYLLSQELEKWTNNFLEKYGPDTVMSLSLREYSPEEIVQIVCSG